MSDADRRWLWGLAGLAISTRLAWALWLHPADEFVFKDMRGYVVHATALVEHGFSPHRSMVFQSWGTYFLLAIPIAIFGPDHLAPAAALWGLASAAVVPLIYLLAREVSEHRGVAIGAGVATLCWYPSLSHAGLFLSEGPFCAAMVATVWRLAVLLRTGRGALGCGLLASFCLALRPESAVAWVLAAGLWLAVRRRHAAAGWREVGLVALPLAITLAFSQWYFHHHTGRWGGVAESSHANLTPARCHHPWVQAFDDAGSFERSTRSTDGRVYGVTSMYEMLRGPDRLDPSHPLALRPAFGEKPGRFELPGPAGPIPIRVSADGVSLKFVGHRADPDVHAAIQAACIERTGVREQARYALVNLSGLWLFNPQWPDNARGGEPYRPWSDAFIVLFQWLIWIPSLLGLRAALAHARERPAFALVAIPLVALMLVAAVWFGSIRLRAPYDAFALLLASDAWLKLATWVRARVRAP